MNCSVWINLHKIDSATSNSSRYVARKCWPRAHTQTSRTYENVNEHEWTGFTFNIDQCENAINMFSIAMLWIRHGFDVLRVTCLHLVCGFLLLLCCFFVSISKRSPILLMIYRMVEIWTLRTRELWNFTSILWHYLRCSWIWCTWI